MPITNPADNPRISFVTADDGCRIAVRLLRSGSTALPPVLAIHALAMDGSMWNDTMPLLSSNVSVLAVDCRGHGRSGKPPGPYSTERFANDLVHVLGQLGHTRAIVTGCSMGGTVALAFAGRFPEKVEGLCLFDTTAWYGEGAPAKWEQRAQTALRQGMGALIEFQLSRWFSPEFLSARSDVVQRALDIFLANDPQAYAETCRMLGVADERSRLHRYTCPALLSVGENDFATPVAMAEDIALRMTQAVVSVIPHVRHFTPFEVPQQIAARIDHVVSRVIHPTA